MIWARWFLGALSLCIGVVAHGHADLEAQIGRLGDDLKKDPKNAALYLRRGELYRYHEEWTKAAKDCDQAQKLDPALAEVELARGKAFYGQGQMAKAVECLDRFLKRQPKEPEGYLFRGRALNRLGRNADAARDFGEVIALVPEPAPEYFIERARAQAGPGGGGAREAIRGLDAGIAKLGAPITLETEALELELSVRNYPAALARVERILAASPRKESWLHRKGEILELAGKPAEARSAYQEASKALQALPERIRSKPNMVELKQKLDQKLKTGAN